MILIGCKALLRFPGYASIRRALVVNLRYVVALLFVSPNHMNQIVATVRSNTASTIYGCGGWPIISCKPHIRLPLGEERGSPNHPKSSAEQNDQPHLLHFLFLLLLNDRLKAV
jgi:hypothetical protein